MQKPKAMIYTWSDEEEDEDEESSSKDNSDEKLCLIVIREEEDDEKVTSPFEDYSCSDWEDAFVELLDKYDHVRRDNKHLKKKINFIVHDNSINEKSACLEVEIFELRKTLDECEQDKVVITNLKSKNENLRNVIDELKLRMQKYEEKTKTVIEKYEAVKGVNEQLQRKIEVLQKEYDDKQNSLKSMT